MINIINGHLTISSTIEIKPNDTLEILDQLGIGEYQELQDLSNGYCWLTLRNVRVKDQYYIISLGFKNKLLKFVSLVFDNDKFSINSGWGIWIKEEELNKVPKFKKWIKEELGREGEFNWGRIGIEYDKKGGSSSIFINYN